MKFQTETFPFPRWSGPYSPARRTNSGFRIRSGMLGATAATDSSQEFWTAKQSTGVLSLIELIQTHWLGGRVVFLPNGFVVKPLPNDSERLLIGRASDALILSGESCAALNFSNLRHLPPGSPWPGPATIGLECAIRPDSSMACSWYRLTDYGQEETQEMIVGPSAALSEGFMRARPGETSGRVRMTIGGHVITNRQERDGSLYPHYVGRVSSSIFSNWERWIEGR